MDLSGVVGVLDLLRIRVWSGMVFGLIGGIQFPSGVFKFAKLKFGSFDSCLASDGSKFNAKFILLIRRDSWILESVLFA